VGIKEAIYEALHRNTSITIDSPSSVVDIVHDTLSTIFVQQDGITVEGALRFKVTVQ
jgi:hypothetical protein